MAGRTGLRWAVLAGLALAVATADVRWRTIPNAVVAVGLGSALALAAAAGRGALAAALLGALTFGGPLFVMWFAGVATHGEGLVGAGDVKAALAFGALLGMPDALAGLWWGAACGGLLALATVGRGLWLGRRALAAALRRHGAVGCLAAIAADPVWSRGIPYGAALSAGSVLAAALLWR